MCIPEWCNPGCRIVSASHYPAAQMIACRRKALLNFPWVKALSLCQLLVASITERRSFTQFTLAEEIVALFFSLE